MSAAGLRFRPPPLVVPPEVRWLLLRAFGPLDAPAPAAVEPQAAVAAARLFDLAPRVAARQGRPRLTAELGAETAAAFQRDRLAATASGIQLGELARRLAEAAAPLGLPLVFLKFAALQLAGLLAEGSRSACDVDVLVPEERALELRDALIAAGFREAPLPAQEHQLPALVHPEAGVVEIHRVLLGVRAGGKGSATLADLERGGLLLPWGLPGRCAIPSPAVLAGHALVHGLGQHGFWPRSYPLLRTIADLVDIGFAGSGVGFAESGVGFAGSGGGALARAAHALIAREISAAESEAARALCAALAAGETDPAGDAGELLRHVLAGRLDPSYERALKLALFKPQPSDRTAAGRLARSLWRAVCLTRGQVDAIYGPPATRLGYVGRRLARPFDLLARWLRYGASAREVARRSPPAPRP